MKKAAILASTFLVVFGLTLGIVLSLNENANASVECTWHCTFKVTWTNQTGPLCPGNCPAGMTNYIVRRSTCTGGPFNCPFVNEVIGCWDPNEQLGCIL
jgi:hypothetical protein